MKNLKTYLPLSILVLLISAFAFISWSVKDSTSKIVPCAPPSNQAVATVERNPSEVFFHYDVASRFRARISAKDLHDAKTILDIVPKKGTEGLEDFENVKIAVLYHDQETVAVGNNEVLTKEQLDLLKSTSYNTDFYIEAYAQERPTESSLQEPYDLIYYMSVVPETEADYEGGQVGLLTYLRDNSSYTVKDLNARILEPGRLRFSVLPDGEVGKIELESSCGVDHVDGEMLSLIETTAGKWTPAKDQNGNPVEQELMFFFGNVGC